MTPYVLFSEFWPPARGGIQNSLIAVAEFFGRDLTVVAPISDLAALGQTDYRIVNRSLFSGAGWPRWWWLVSWVRQARRAGATEFMFGHFSNAVLATLFVRQLNYGLIIHGLDILTEYRKWWLRYAIRLALRRASWISANSSFTRDQLLALGVNQAKVFYGHPSVDRQVVERATISHHQGHRLISVGRLVPRKNIGAVITALAALRQPWPDITLDIIGDGPEKDNLMALAAKLGVADSVIFHGNVSDDKKWHLLSAADIFVLIPTIRDSGSDIEGFGIVYAEAAAAGLPVIGSNTGGIKDAVVDGQTGRLIDPADQAGLLSIINQWFASPETRNGIGQAGRHYVLNNIVSDIRAKRIYYAAAGSTQTDPPLVSIIIPAYQAAQTIGATIDSVLAQTWPNYEIVVINDGSTDDTEQRLKSYSEKIIYRAQTNQGAPVARNNGASLAKGEYLLFLDADTILKPDALTKFATALQVYPDVDYVYSNFKFGFKNFDLFEYSAERLKQNNYIHTTSLIRRQSFTGFDPALKRFQDWDLWLTMAEANKQGMWLPERLFSVITRDKAIGISAWLPSFTYQLPLIGQGRGNAAITKYRQAEAVIRAKHHI